MHRRVVRRLYRQPRLKVEMVSGPEAERLLAGVKRRMWLEQNPCPDLQEFVRKHGDYRRMPPGEWATFSRGDQVKMIRNGAYRLVRPDEWARYDEQLAAWQAERRLRYRR